MFFSFNYLLLSQKSVPLQCVLAQFENLGELVKNTIFVA